MAAKVGLFSTAELTEVNSLQGTEAIERARVVCQNSGTLTFQLMLG